MTRLSCRCGSLRTFIALSLLCLTAAEVGAQSRVAAEPVVGLRENALSVYALTSARVVSRPGQVLEDAVVLIEGTSITAVGKQVTIPAGAKTIDCTGRTIYAGLIDAWGEAEVPVSQSDAVHWNSNITPQRSAKTVAGDGVSNASKLRSQGVTARLVAPEGGIIKGTSCVVLLSEEDSGRKLLADHTWQHLQLTVPRGSRSRYPNSPMGAVALLRQTLHDANWYRDAWSAYQAKTRLPRPETNLALDALARAIAQDTFVIDAPNERMAIRADNIAREFSLRMIIRGSGREYRQLNEIVAAGRPLLIPVDFPGPPAVKTARAARNTTLQELMHWDLAPENPSRLAQAGLSICLTTDGLDDVGQFLKQVRKAVQRGLSENEALAAMTTTPAELLGINDVTGRVEPGMLANLVVTDGDLFDDDTKIIETWVAGHSFEVTEPDKSNEDALAGYWNARFRSGRQNVAIQLRLKPGTKSFSAVAQAEPSQPNSEDEDDEQERKEVKLTDTLRQRDRLTASIELSKVDDLLPAGVSHLTLITVTEQEGEPLTVIGTIELPDGSLQKVTMTRTEAPDEEHDAEEDEESDSNDGDSQPEQDEDQEQADDQDDAVADVTVNKIATPVLYPLGAYGRTAPIDESPHVMFRGATIWSCDQAGTVPVGDLLVREGRVVAIGKNLAVPEGCRVIDVSGKHITPGLIDCHSHMGTDGGVNESGQAVTAEVRIGDFIDNSDITIYRQLAGGLTTSNILHGSANPIGGQNQVIKLRWGQTMDGLRMSEAPPGIKFALGENVKRSTSRYPNTRMGVEQIIRDQLLAAREYDAAWRRWRSGDHDSLPPRIDLQLAALAEVQRGERWIHCHSYRQDEIVATLDVLEEFGIRIGTLQHILEGYKVADRMARHGAMASAFSDWWAYKFEVYDGIPYNGALMHRAGIVVSFNSDDREIGRRLNTEAAKATKYGGVPEEEALKFVTLNPAKQLRIDQHVGSLAPGKHADIVVWSGRPLSTMTRCEQTWIDGRLYFDLETDRETRQRDAKLRASLIQKVLNGGGWPASKKKDEIDEEDRWLRHDVYCRAHGSAKYDHTGHLRLHQAEQQKQ